MKRRTSKYGDPDAWKTRLYATWCSMRHRCRHDPDYAGRGIKVCSEWEHSFLAFRDWALRSGYSDKLQIDRINNDGNYEPGNCRFVTCKENHRNRRRVKIFPGGKTAADVAKELGMSLSAIHARISKTGMSLEEAMTLPKTPNGYMRKVAFLRWRRPNETWE